MIHINNYSPQKVVCEIADLIEPYIVKKLQKQFHTFFIYRCSDYISFQHLIKSQQFNISKFRTLIPFIEKYWSSIDLIHLKVPQTKNYIPSKYYFDTLRKISLLPKEVIDLDFYEIKLTSNAPKSKNNSGLPNLSIRTYEFSQKLLDFNKELLFVPVKLSGDFSLSFNIESLCPKNFDVRTHYGRAGYSNKIHL